ncbi:MAG: hypothetical protein ACOC8A_00940 [bacterium]
MNLQRLKELAFRHCEKIALAIVVVFVAFNLYAHFGKPQEQARVAPPPAGGRGGEAQVQEVPPYYTHTAAPFVQTPEPVQPLYDPFWLPANIRLENVVVGVDEAAQRTVQSRIVNAPRRVDMDLSEQAQLPPVNATVPSVLEVRHEDKTLVFRGNTPGKWVKYVAGLEDGNKVIVYARVKSPETEIRYVVLPPREVEIREETFGEVEIAFQAPEPKAEERDEQTRRITQFLVPTSYAILRKASDEEEAVQVGEVRARAEGAGGRPETGVEDLPRGHPARRGEGRPARREGEGARLTFVDRTAESDTRYVYLVKGRASDPQGEVRESEPVTQEFKTEARFNFAYVGGTPQYASIVVFIGPQDNPQAWRKYDKVRIGSRVGEMPGQEAPAEGTGAAASPDQRFVTGYMLVDIVYDAFQLVEQVRKKRVKTPLGTEIVEEKTYWAKRGKYVLLRNAKNEFVVKWLTTGLRLPEGTRAEGPGTGAGAASFR